MVGLEGSQGVQCSMRRPPNPSPTAPRPVPYAAPAMVGRARVFLLPVSGFLLAVLHTVTLLARGVAWACVACMRRRVAAYSCAGMALLWGVGLLACAEVTRYDGTGGGSS